MKVTQRPAATLQLPAAPARLLRFGDFEIDVATRELRRAGECAALRRQVFDLLLLLIERRPGTVTRDELRGAMGEHGTQAANAVARAVFEARRAIGDPHDQPRYIINVHGVGYRFVGQPAEQPAGGGARPITPVARTRAHLQDAEEAYEQRNDLARARLHAEAALAEALHNGLTVESGHALCWLGWLATWQGAAEEAARHVGHALHLAQREDHALLLARARTVDAFMRITLDEFDTAMAQLTAAQPVLAQKGQPGDLYRCEHLMSVVARHVGTLDAARHWCLQAQRTAQAGGLHLGWLRALGSECMLEMERGDLLDRDGASDAARTAWQSALELCERLLQQTVPAQDPFVYAGNLCSRGTLLGRLRRFGEAREAFAALERFLDRHPGRDTPQMLDRRLMLQVFRSRICVLEGDHAGAMRHVESGLAQADAQFCRGHWRAALYELGSEVAEHCGQLERALRWSREHLSAQLALRGERARSMTSAMQAQAQLDALRADLDATRREVMLLESLNADLLRRLHGGDETGTAPFSFDPV